MTDINSLKDLICKTVAVFQQLADGKSFKYEGILLDITDTMVVLKDFKTGIVALPISQCTIKEVRK
jgi:hypothetical protein